MYLLQEEMSIHISKIKSVDYCFKGGYFKFFVKSTFSVLITEMPFFLTQKTGKVK